MKHIPLLMTAATLFGTTQFLLAQKEPVGLAPAPIAAGATPPTAESPAVGLPRTSRKSPQAAGNATVSGAGLTTGANFFSTGSRGDAIPPVVIRFSQPDPKTSATLEEDLFVMARVISGTLERAEAENVKFKMGVPILLTGSGRSVRPMYVEGMGPLFMIKVNFPLLPPAKKTDEKASGDKRTTLWDEAHQDVFGDPDVANEYSPRSSSYSDEKVELLKKELIVALKEATNIRALKPDEFVNIAAFGHATSQRGKSGTTAEAAYETVRTASASKGSVLTLRAKKSDIDGWAAGAMTDEAFKSKVTMTAYFGSGSGISSINSWIQESPSRILR